MKKKAEQRLAQIKKTFGSQLEEKLSKISELSEKNADLESQVASLQQEFAVTSENVRKEMEQQHEIERDNLTTKITQLENLIKETQDTVSAMIAARILFLDLAFWYLFLPRQYVLAGTAGIFLYLLSFLKALNIIFFLELFLIDRRLSCHNDMACRCVEIRTDKGVLCIVFYYR